MVLHWEEGREVVSSLIDAGRIERVPPNREHAELLLDEARRHLQSARVLLDHTDDTSAAFVTAYDAARKALTAVLASQGLRTRSGDGGHAVLSEIVEAQAPHIRRIISPFSRMRRLRNQTEYPDFDKPTATTDDVDWALPAAQTIVNAAAKLVEVMPPF